MFSVVQPARNALLTGQEKKSAKCSTFLSKFFLLSFTDVFGLRLYEKVNSTGKLEICFQRLARRLDTVAICFASLSIAPPVFRLIRFSTLILVLAGKSNVCCSNHLFSLSVAWKYNLHMRCQNYRRYPDQKRAHSWCNIDKNLQLAQTPTIHYYVDCPCDRFKAVEMLEEVEKFR